MNPGTASPDRPRRLLLIAAVSLAALAWLTFRFTFELGLLGWDSYPMILTARITSFGDFLGTFTEELMDGRYPRGHWFRPVTNLSFALDHALWGLNARGYHATDVAILAGNALLLFAFVRRLFGARFLVAAAIAAVLFTIHPIQVEIIPVPPRRADTLCLFFTLACLYVLARESVAPLRWRLSCGLLALLAVGAKETGVIVAPLAFGLAFFAAGTRPIPARLKAAARRSSPAVLAVALFAVWRAAVLGGLGGNQATSLAAITEILDRVQPYVARLLTPQPLGVSPAIGAVIVAACGVALFLLAVAVYRRPGTSAVAERAKIRAGLLFVALWFVSLLAISALAAQVEEWYAMPFVAPYAILVGVIADRGVHALRARRLSLALPALGLSALLLVNHAVFSPLFHPYPRWQRVDELARNTLRRFEAATLAARPGRSAVLRSFVPGLPRRADGRGIRSAAILSDYSLQAYAELVMPERKVEIVRHDANGPAPPPSSPDVIQVILVPGPPPHR